MKGMRRLSFERGFAPLCHLNGVGSAKSAVGSLFYQSRKAAIQNSYFRA